MPTQRARKPPGRRSGRPPRADGDETRARIVRTATERFALLGYSDTPVSVLAEDADVTPGTLYYYFPSKAELYEAVASAARIQIAERLVEPVLAAVAGDASLSSRLTFLVETLVRRAGEDMTLHRLQLASDLEADSVPVVAAFRDGVRDDLRRLYLGVAGVAWDGSVTAEDADLVAFIETLTLGVWHFAMRPNGLERLPVFALGFGELLDGSLFGDETTA